MIRKANDFTNEQSWQIDKPNTKFTNHHPVMDLTISSVNQTTSSPVNYHRSDSEIHIIGVAKFHTVAKELTVTRALAVTINPRCYKLSTNGLPAEKPE